MAGSTNKISSVIVAATNTVPREAHSPLRSSSHRQQTAPAMGRIINTGRRLMQRFVKYGSPLPAFLTSSMSVSMALASKQLPAKTPSTSTLVSFLITAQFDRRAAGSSQAQITVWSEIRRGPHLSRPPNHPTTPGLMHRRGGKWGAQVVIKLPRTSERKARPS